MAQALIYSPVTCPSCFSVNQKEIDISGGSQDYYEDCEVCCSPMELFVHIDDQGEVTRIDVTPGND